MLCANPMPRANDASLKQRERRLDGIGVNVPFDVNVVLVLDGLVASSMYSRFHHGFWICGKLICNDHFDGIGRDVLADVLRQSPAPNIVGMKETQLSRRIFCAIALSNTNNNFLGSARSRSVSSSTLATTNIGLIDFHRASKRRLWRN